MDVYLDHAASTPLRPEAIAALADGAAASNASAPHAAGRQARTRVEQAREQIAQTLGCSPHEVVFTSGGTEADNLIVKGVVWAAHERSRMIPHVVVSAVEHPAVLEPARWLAARGMARLTEVAPEPDGRVDPQAVFDAVNDDTVLVSVMTANNETGAVNDVAGLAELLADRGVVVHTDAVQAFATLPLPSQHVDALALSAHKFGGPQGVGVAMLRRAMPITPLTHGGGQDRGVRSGTFAVALDEACGAAIVAADADRDALRERLGRMSARIVEVLGALDGVRSTGPVDPEHRLASHVHLSIDDVDGEALTMELDRAGIAAASGAACGSGAARPSHVLAAMGARGTPLRLSLGWTTTGDEVETAIDVLADLVPRLRAASTSAAVSTPVGSAYSLGGA